MKKLGLKEWIMCMFQAICMKTLLLESRVDDTYSDAVGVKVDVHQGSDY